MEQLLPGLEVQPVIIWLPRETQFNCLAIRIKYIPEETILPYMLRLKGFGLRGGETYIFLLILGPDLLIGYKSLKWADPMLQNVHNFLEHNWERLKDGKSVFIYERTPVHGIQTKERVTFSEFRRREAELLKQRTLPSPL